MIEYAIRSSKGHIIEGPGWTCVADVMGAAHGQGRGRIGGTLVRRVDGGEWEDVPIPAGYPARTTRGESDEH